MLIRFYELIMDDNRNPFRGLPKLIRFRLMLMLAYMWSSVFSIWVGSMMSLWPMIVGHTAVLLAVFFTADIFKRAHTETHRCYKTRFANPRDNCSRYDDLWGG